MKNTSTCQACGEEMPARSSWDQFCQSCGFLRSKLCQGGGIDVDGLKDLRKENYEEILDKIQTLMPIKSARLLEVGSAWEGWS